MSTLTLTWTQVLVLLLGVLAIYALEMAFFYWRLRRHNFADQFARLRMQQLEEKLALLQRQLYPDPWPSMPGAGTDAHSSEDELLDEEPVASASTSVLRAETQAEQAAAPDSAAPPPEAGASYNRAIDLARTGADASILSRDCGLSRGEADLIVALYGPKSR